MNFKIVMAMLKANLTDKVVDAAKAAGGTGATIIPARGTGIHEAKTFFGLTLDAQTDVIVFLLADELIEPVIEAISKAGKFHKPGTGIAVVLPVERVVGLESQIEHFAKKTLSKSS
jgi:nitrogen regulatory protein PII